MPVLLNTTVFPIQAPHGVVVDIFKDYYDMSTGRLYYRDFVAKYSFTHLLVNKDELLNNCLKHDSEYRVIFQDKMFLLYERIILVGFWNSLTRGPHFSSFRQAGAEGTTLVVLPGKGAASGGLAGSF